MTYKEALEQVKNVEWKTSICHSGEECWCRVIEPSEPLTDDDGNEIYIATSGSIHKEHAEYIVNLHNEKLKNKI